MSPPLCVRSLSDTETTGLDHDRIVEIGAVKLVNHSLTGQTFHPYLYPERAIPADAFAVHGLSVEFLADNPLFGDVVDEFVAFIGDARRTMPDLTLPFSRAEARRQAADCRRARG
jgi:DNA polymerase III epsilon subunit-like protein